jgi:hypothetical protein
VLDLDHFENSADAAGHADTAWKREKGKEKRGLERAICSELALRRFMLIPIFVSYIPPAEC